MIGEEIRRLRLQKENALEALMEAIDQRNKAREELAAVQEIVEAAEAVVWHDAMEPSLWPSDAEEVLTWKEKREELLYCLWTKVRKTIEEKL